jgi:hypothetical protein
MRHRQALAEIRVLVRDSYEYIRIFQPITVCSGGNSGGLSLAAIGRFFRIWAV